MMISSFNENLCSLSHTLNLGNRKMSLGARSGKYGSKRSTQSNALTYAINLRISNSSVNRVYDKYVFPIFSQLLLILYNFNSCPVQLGTNNGMAHFKSTSSQIYQ
ncbi:PREDICTED: uncharacterized protein LOC108751251 [Trachymyrmex septentrionalis]|uniref:uncharacterized protein LOC108751251 n=1 Tax=Trachymyrmex septentrionalis TaxID=34720 RepID=UPI00084F3791|nr:PREDICTED: uncharacterized protein LOC108751251 [Trachymyrmex septentrionalis]